MKIKIDKPNKSRRRIRELEAMLVDLDWMIDQPSWLWYREGINSAILKKLAIKKEIQTLEKEDETND